MSDDPDFRFYASFRDNPKRMELEHEIGSRGLIALVDFWCWVRTTRALGDLSGLSDRSLEMGARWRGKPGAFLAALVRYGWLDGTSGSYIVHGWDERQDWAKAAPARSRAGKVAAIVKQARKHGVSTDQWLDDVGGADAVNDDLRTRARAAFLKKQPSRTTNRSTNRADRAYENATNRANRESPDSDPDPDPDASRGEGGGGDSDAGRSASGPPSSSPSRKIPCAACLSSGAPDGGKPYAALVGPGTGFGGVAYSEPLCEHHMRLRASQNGHAGTPS